MKTKNKIDNVTLENLDLALKMCSIHICQDTLDKIIDIIELIEEKGDLTSIQDIMKLKKEWGE